MVLRICTSLDYLRGDREHKGDGENETDKNNINNLQRRKRTGIQP